MRIRGIAVLLGASLLLGHVPEVVSASTETAANRRIPSGQHMANLPVLLSPTIVEFPFAQTADADTNADLAILGPIVYAVWQEGSNIRFDVSLNVGSEWNNARVMLLDRYEIGERATSACAAPTQWLHNLDLSPTIEQTFDSLCVHTPGLTASWPLPWTFSTFDYRSLCQRLLSRVGATTHFETAKVHGRTGHVVYTDRGDLPAGYGWSFPAARECRIGVGSFDPHFHVKEPTLRLVGDLGAQPVG